MSRTRAGHTAGCGRPSRVRRLRLVAVLVPLALGAAAAGCTSAAERDVPATGPVRTVPSGVLLAAPVDEGEEGTNSTFAVLLDLVRRTPADERIRIVGNSFSFVPAAQALVEAHRRGVHVQVIIDRGASGEWKAPALLREALGTDRRADSFVYLAPGKVHHKIWSFTRTAGRRDVVLVGSMNLTYRSAQQYTDVIAYAGRRGVRRHFDRRFVQLSRFLPVLPPGGPVDLGRDRAWFYPGDAAHRDPVMTMLEAVPPDGARIRVVMYAWLDARGLELAGLLAAKDAAGADVEVVLGTSTGPTVRKVLESSGIEVHTGVFADGDDVHHKLTVVSHPAAAGGRTRFVLTGSDNYTTRSLDRPELLLRVDGTRGTAFAQYSRWVDALVRRGVRERA